MLSSASLAQTAPAQPAEPGQQTPSTQQAEAAKPETASQPAAPLPSPAEAAPAGDAAAASVPIPEAAKPGVGGQLPAASPAPAEVAPTADVASAPADVVPDVPAVASGPAPFGAGAKLFLEPMDGFAELLGEAIAKKKVPVVLVHDRAAADFVMSGDARVKKPGWIKGILFYPHAKASLAIRDAHTGDVVFAYKLDEEQESMSVGELYESSAYACAKRLKKAIEKK